MEIYQHSERNFLEIRPSHSFWTLSHSMEHQLLYIPVISYTVVTQCYYAMQSWVDVSILLALLSDTGKFICVNERDLDMYVYYLKCVIWEYCQLRARRALSLFNYVLLRFKRVLSLYKVNEDSALLVLKGTFSVVITSFCFLASNVIMQCIKFCKLGSFLVQKSREAVMA